MKSRHAALFAALALALAAACDEAPVGPGAQVCLQGVFGPADIVGTLDYVAYADSGARLLEGTLTVMGQANQHIAGSWDIHWAAGADTTNPNTVGPQVGTGDLIGAVQDTVVFVNLTPTFADDNVELDACVTAGGFAGVWRHIGAAGEIAHGPVTAIRR
jgi:hypothetical protein